MQNSDLINKDYAALVVEVCDDKQLACWANGFGPEFMIRSSFKHWISWLKRAEGVHLITHQTKIYSKWWNEKIGKIGRKPMTRKTLVNRRTIPRSWSLSL